MPGLISTMSHLLPQLRKRWLKKKNTKQNNETVGTEWYLLVDGLWVRVLQGGHFLHNHILACDQEETISGIFGTYPGACHLLGLISYL